MALRKTIAVRFGNASKADAFICPYGCKKKTTTGVSPHKFVEIQTLNTLYEHMKKYHSDKVNGYCLIMDLSVQDLCSSDYYTDIDFNMEFVRQLPGSAAGDIPVSIGNPVPPILASTRDVAENLDIKFAGMEVSELNSGGGGTASAVGGGTASACVIINRNSVETINTSTPSVASIIAEKEAKKNF